MMPSAAVLGGFDLMPILKKSSDRENVTADDTDLDSTDDTDTDPADNVDELFTSDKERICDSINRG